eukprot:7558094-Pyramimonas_sp.AAC.1
MDHIQASSRPSRQFAGRSSLADRQALAQGVAPLPRVDRQIAPRSKVVDDLRPRWLHAELVVEGAGVLL